MTNKRNIALIALITLSAAPVQALPSLSTIWTQSTPQEKRMAAQCSVGAVAVMAIGYGLYRYFRAPSNAALRSQARAVYNRMHQRYGKLKFVTSPDRMKITQAGDLFAMTSHKNLPLIKRVTGDLPALKKQISLLSARINKDSDNGNTDGAMQSLYNQMRSLEEKLDHVSRFWKSHVQFFTMHDYLTQLSGMYNKYDYNNSEAIRMQIRGDATGKYGDAYTYPFKTFTTALSLHINTLHERIQSLRTKARSFADRELIANEYYNMLSQAEPFQQALIYVRDVAANQPEYATEIAHYEKAEQKRAELAAQERAIAAKAQADRERAQAEREKAEAIRYKARMDYLAKTQKPAAQTNVTVVNQTADTKTDAYAADNNA